MKKILFISSRPPYPLVGGDKIRYYNTIKILSQKYLVDIVYLDKSSNITTSNSCILPFVNSIFHIYHPQYLSIINVLLGLISNKNPLQINYYLSKCLRRWIQDNINNYDIVYCNHIRTSEYVKDLNCVKVLDLVDSLSMNYAKAKKSSIGLWKLIYTIEAKRVKKYEQEIVKYFDKVTLISEVDREYVCKNAKYPINIDIIENYVDESFKFDDLCFDEDNYCIGFIGKMDYEPNISAVCFFTSNIFPLIKKKYPDAKFYIIGAYPVKKVLELQHIDGVIVTGFVDSLKPYIYKCSVFVAPMISGAGVQNKILQLMLNNKAVVTTTIGSEGLTNLKGDELIIVDDNEGFARIVCELFDDKNFRKNVGDKAAAYINMNLSYDVISKKLLDIVNLSKFDSDEK